MVSKLRFVAFVRSGCEVSTSRTDTLTHTNRSYSRKSCFWRVFLRIQIDIDYIQKYTHNIIIIHC